MGYIIPAYLTSKIWSPGASLPSRAAIESLTISWMTMFPSGVSFPPTMRRPSSSSGSSLNSSTTLASATRLHRRGVSGGRRNREPSGINMAVFSVYEEHIQLSLAELHLVKYLINIQYVQYVIIKCSSVLL